MSDEPNDVPRIPIFQRLRRLAPPGIPTDDRSRMRMVVDSLVLSQPTPTTIPNAQVAPETQATAEIQTTAEVQATPTAQAHQPGAEAGGGGQGTGQQGTGQAAQGEHASGTGTGPAWALVGGAGGMALILIGWALLCLRRLPVV